MVNFQSPYLTPFRQTHGLFILQGVSWIVYSTGCLQHRLHYKVYQRQVTLQGVSRTEYSTGCLMDSLLYRVSLELFTFTGCLQHRLQLTRQGVSTFFKDRLHYRMSQHFSTINYSTGCLNSQNFSRIDYSLGCCFFISITNLFYF